MTRPAMTGTQADALAAFIVTLRPGQSRWSKAAIYDALTDAAAKFTPDAETLTRAAVRAALTSSIIDPTVIPMPGAHWESVNHTPVHEPERAGRCDVCHAIHLRGTPHVERPSAHHSSYADKARQSIRKTKRYAAEAPLSQNVEHRTSTDTPPEET